MAALTLCIPACACVSCVPYLQHRDLKLENILLEHAGPGAAVKLVDFGLSAIFEEDGVSHDILGSWVRKEQDTCMYL